MKERGRDRWVVASLLLLAVIPTLGGIARMSVLARANNVTADDLRLAAHPFALALHIVGATLFTVLGALQFSRSFARARGRWHRAIGWVIAPLGACSALAGVWLALTVAPQPDGSATLTALRVLAGSAMTAAIALGVHHAIRGDLAAHRRWMTRAYAIGAAAGTQAFTLALLSLAQPLDARARVAIAMTLGWLVNILVAEASLRRSLTERAQRAAMTA